MSKVTSVMIFSPTSVPVQVERTLVMFATTSIAAESRLLAGSNRVTSPAGATTATGGQAV